MVEDGIVKLSQRLFLKPCINRSGYDVVFFKLGSDRSKANPALRSVGPYALSLKSSAPFKVKATEVDSGQPQWWEKNVPHNMADIHSTQDFLNVLSQAEERLVVVDFYGTWCASCRALFPKLCKIAEEHPEILFLKVNFDENKSLCKSLNIKVLPYFHFYRGANGLLESFSCSLAKFQKLKDAIATHNRSSSIMTTPSENASESTS